MVYFSNERMHIRLKRLIISKIKRRELFHMLKVIQAISLDKYIKYRTGSYLSKGEVQKTYDFYMKYFFHEYQCQNYANENIYFGFFIFLSRKKEALLTLFHYKYIICISISFFV